MINNRILLKLANKNINFISKFRASQKQIEDKLKEKLKPSFLNVQDISGGCGQSFKIQIKSEEFKGKTIILQHRLVNEILKDELKEIHALQLKTEIEESKI